MSASDAFNDDAVRTALYERCEKKLRDEDVRLIAHYAIATFLMSRMVKDGPALTAHEAISRAYNAVTSVSDALADGVSVEAHPKMFENDVLLLVLSGSMEEMRTTLNGQSADDYITTAKQGFSQRSVLDFYDELDKLR